MVSAAQLKEIFPKMQDPSLWARVLAPACNEFSIEGAGEMAEFLAQCGHESASFNRLTENLNYSGRGLMETWPKRFPSIEFSAQYARQPIKIANRVYASRLGNGDEASGDGFRFRGRGLIQITGRANYAACGQALNVPLEMFPQKLEDPINAARSAAWFWHSRNLDLFIGDIEHDTKVINGGLTGLVDRKEIYERAKLVLSKGV